MISKKAGIHIVLLVGLVTVCAGAAILAVSISGRYHTKEDYERMENRYIAESGCDLAVGLFLNYLENQDYVVQFERSEDGSYQIKDAYAPYLIDDIRQSESADNIPIRLAETESCDYLSSIGYLNFKRGDGISLSLNTFSQKENFKLSRLCIDPGFVVSRNTESSTVQSRINPIYLDVKVQYKGGEVTCKVRISGITVRRNPFYALGIGETGSVSAELDTAHAKAEYNNYQNYIIFSD